MPKDGALDVKQVGATEGTPLGDCSLVSPWEHRKEHWRAQGRSTRRKIGRSHRGNATWRLQLGVAVGTQKGALEGPRTEH